MDINALEKLYELLQKGAITKEEYQKAKDDFFEKNNNKTFDLDFEKINASVNLEITEHQKTYNMFLHLSVLLGVVPVWLELDFVSPWFGLIVPLVMWWYKKDQVKSVDNHGKIVLNWLLTMGILYVVFFILKIILVGFALTYILSILNVTFAVIGAIKAKDGILWVYPGSISFFKVNNANAEITDHLEV